MSEQYVTRPAPGVASIDVDGPGCWRPDPVVADLVADVLSRAYYAGRGLDGIATFAVDGAERVEHLTDRGTRRLLAIGPFARLPRGHLGRVKASLQALADGVQSEIDALAIARGSDALAVARAAAERRWESAG